MNLFCGSWHLTHNFAFKEPYLSVMFPLSEHDGSGILVPDC